MSRTTVSEHELDESRISDPLSETTRKERRALLAVSGLTFAIVLGDLVPTTISSFGITVAVGQQRVLLYLLASLNLYFLVAFISYAMADLTAWEATKRRLMWEHARVMVDELEEEQHGEVQDRGAAERWEAVRWERSRRAYRYRKFVDFVLPIVIATGSIAISLTRAFMWQM